MRAPQSRLSKQAEVIEAAATIVLAWRRGLRPGADVVLGQPYVFDQVEALLGVTVPEAPTSKIRERAHREETAAAIDIVLAGSIGFRVITGNGTIDPKALHRAAALAKRIATRREIQKVVTHAIERAERDLRADDVQAAVDNLSAQLAARDRLERDQVEALLGEQIRLGRRWWANLSAPTTAQRRSEVAGRRLRSSFPAQ